MKSILIVILSILSLKSWAEPHLICGFQESTWSEGCAERTYHEDAFSVFFEKTTNGTFSYVQVKSVVSDDVTYTVLTSDDWIGLEITTKINGRSISSQASRWFSQHGDTIRVGASEHGSSSNYCPAKSFELLCIFQKD